MRKRKSLTFVQKMDKLLSGGMLHNKRASTVASDIAPLEERVKKILGIAERLKKDKGRMLFFVMYDIESDKVRTQVVRYLERSGCTRIQRSIFLADAEISVYEKIKDDLAYVQSVYDNEDSIIVLPVTTDYLRMMKIIGKNIEVDIITNARNTLFF